MIRFLKLWSFTIAEIIMVSFALMFIAFFCLGDINYAVIWMLTLPLYSFLGIGLRMLFPHRSLLQFLIGIPLCILGTILTLQMLAVTLEVFIGGVILGSSMSLVLLFRSRSFVETDWSELLPAFVAFCFIILNFVTLFIIVIAPVLSPIYPYITALGPFVILVNLLSLSTLNLHTITEAGNYSSIKNRVAVSKSIGIQNRFLIILLYTVTLVVSLWDKLIVVFNFFMGIVGKILSLISYLIPDLQDGQSTDTATGEAALGGVAEEVTRNPFWAKVGDIVIYATCIIGVIGFIVFISYNVYRVIKKLIPVVKEYLNKYMDLDNNTDEYTDTQERLVDLKDLPKKYLNLAAEWLQDLLYREPKWEEMKTVEDKVRFLYRRAIHKGMAKGTLFDAAKTPTETVDGLTPTITSAEVGSLLKFYYNNTRYGGVLPSEEEVNALYQKLNA